MASLHEEVARKIRDTFPLNPTSQDIAEVLAQSYGSPRLASLIARAIVHLNFNEPDEAKEVLFDALTDFNFDFHRSQTQSLAAKEAA